MGIQIWKRNSGYTHLARVSCYCLNCGLHARLLIDAQTLPCVETFLAMTSVGTEVAMSDVCAGYDGAAEQRAGN
jgi:hypothetical protein